MTSANQRKSLWRWNGWIPDDVDINPRSGGGRSHYFLMIESQVLQEVSEMLRRLFVTILGVLMFFLTTGPGYAFKDNIVAAWTFEEGSGKVVGDVSGNNNDGELMGGPKWVDGKFGKALEFDGSSNHIEVPFGESMGVLNTGDFTIAAWFKFDIVAKKQVIFQQGDAGGTGRTWLFIAVDDEIRSFLGNGTTASGINAEAEDWYHTAVVVIEGGDTDSVQLYVNGEIAGAPFAAGMEDSGGIFFIGCHKNITDLMDGIIDELVLVNKALSEAEIKDLMNNGLANIIAVEPTGKLAVSWGEIKSSK